VRTGRGTWATSWLTPQRVERPAASPWILLDVEFFSMYLQALPTKKNKNSYVSDPTIKII
jgi:hypothetical protein